MSFKEVREELHNVMGLDPGSEKISSDVDLLDAYYACKFSFIFGTLGFCKHLFILHLKGCAHRRAKMFISSQLLQQQTLRSLM